MRNSTRYWQMHPEIRTNCYELWRRLATRYKDLPASAVAYDFFNEPAYMHRDDWNRIIKDLTQIVRSVDQKHLIVCEAGDGWSQPQWFHWVQPTGDTNTIYSFHHYGKHWGMIAMNTIRAIRGRRKGKRHPPRSDRVRPPPQRAPPLRRIWRIHDLPRHGPLVWLDEYLARFERSASAGIGGIGAVPTFTVPVSSGDEISPNLALSKSGSRARKPGDELN